MKKVKVSFRRGPSGHLRQDPSDEARRIKDNPSLQDKSAPQRGQVVKENACSIVFKRGGDISDIQEVLGEYVLQFGKYKGKSFRWLLENDVGYTLYLIRKVEDEEKAGQFNPEGPKKDNLLSFLEYVRGFQDILDVIHYLAGKSTSPTVKSEDENLVGFGVHAGKTWKDIWDSRENGYAAFILRKQCVPGSKMYRLQQYLRLKHSNLQMTLGASAPSRPALPDTSTNPPGLQVVGLHGAKARSHSTSTVSKASDSSNTAPATEKIPLPVPQQLLALALPSSDALSQPTASTKEGTQLVQVQQHHGPPVTSAASQPQARSEAPHSQQPAAPVARYDDDISRWNCSHHQQIWMKSELESMGLWPGSLPARHFSVSLWRHPPQPELTDTTTELPSPKTFQLHPFFIWKPEHAIMHRLRNNYILPCLYGCLNPQVTSAGIGRPRVITGISGQYYIFASRLCCKVCKKYWHADKPQWLEKLPARFKHIFPAFITYKKAICKSVMDELRRTGKSPNDMANQLTEMLHLKYERANFAYLLSVQNIKDGEAGLYGQKTITGFVKKSELPNAFGQYEDTDGWCGVSVSAHYLADSLIQEYRRQESVLNLLLQGTFGQVIRCDHTRQVARKVTFSSGTMSSYAVMNENWMILSWVMLQSECEPSLEPLYEGLARRYSAAGLQKAKFQWVDRDCCAAFKVLDPAPHEHLQWVSWKTTEDMVKEATSGNVTNMCASRSQYNNDIVVKLDLFHCMRRFLRECVSEHHSLYSTFSQFLSAAFSVVDHGDLEKLREAYRFCGISPPNPTKQHIREHCRIKIPQPLELLKRMEDVLHHFHLATDPNGLRLFKPSMLKTWRIQRIHILRSCLSDPEVEEGILYRYGGTLQLNHVPGEGAAVPIWIPVRGTSQQEGFHFHQAQWVTGTRVSPELFQAQGMTGVVRWNFQRLVDLKLPDVALPSAFDPLLILELNMASVKVTGQAKYPVLQTSSRDTGERFGLQYVEPGCRPAPLDWEKHKTRKTVQTPKAVECEGHSPSVSQPSVLKMFHYNVSSEEPVMEDTAQDMKGRPLEMTAEVHSTLEGQIMQSQQYTPSTPALSSSEIKEGHLNISLHAGRTPPPLPLSASPQAARIGPIKTGGRVFVLDHSRWTQPMRDAIDALLIKYHGQKDMLKLVDADYATMVHSACTDPNSLLHSTTKQHISRYVKHLAKKKNTSSSLNTSEERLQETQHLWQRLTTGSETLMVPVTTLPPAEFNPPTVSPPALEGPLTKDDVERIVKEIVIKQQALQQPGQNKTTRNCLSCGQPKSRFLGDGSSVHFFYQSAEVNYFYCSHKVFQTYAAKGLTDPRMSFQDFAATSFFQQELKSSKERAAEKKRVMEERRKRKSQEEHPSGRLCRFCHLPLKQGPNSPHIHSGFTGVPGKYIYCPAKVFFLYQAKGMQAEMTWREFQNSPFYEAEKQRWSVERKK